MRKLFQTIFILITILSFWIVVSSAFGQKPLEATYPAVPGVTTPETTATTIPDYIRYIYFVSFSLSGLIAFLVILREGLRYLTAIDKPANLVAVRKNIQSILGGVLILVFAYLIFSTINPEILSFRSLFLPALPSQPITSSPTFRYTSDLLTRLATLAEDARSSANTTLNFASGIKSLTDNCSCGNTASLCQCDGGSVGSQCNALNCYVGPNSHPCGQLKDQIESAQKQIADLKDKIGFLGNKSLAEKDDLRENITKIVDEKIKWYEQNIAEEIKVLGQVQGEDAKKYQQGIIDNLQESRNWLNDEKRYKTDLVSDLTDLAQKLKMLSESANQIFQLPQQCTTNVKDKCQARCKSGVEPPGVNGCISDIPCLYGCHNASLGCQPDTCQGGNPCPTMEINIELQKVRETAAEINRITALIIKTINLIPEKRQSSF